MRTSKMKNKLNDLEDVLTQADNIFLQNIELTGSPQTHIREFVGMLEDSTSSLPDSELPDAELIVELVTKALRRVCRLADMQQHTMSLE